MQKERDQQHAGQNQIIKTQGYSGMIAKIRSVKTIGVTLQTDTPSPTPGPCVINSATWAHIARLGKI